MEPQITAIASQLAVELPTEGASLEEATQTWRHSLRYARQSGVIDEITEKIEAERPELRVVCAELRRK